MNGPIDVFSGRPIPIHDEAGFAGMRVAGQLAARTLDFIAEHIAPGISTGEVDRLCDTFMRDNGGVPATVGYKGYQHATCTSVNHVVTHGVPDDGKVLRDGDIINVDVTPNVNGWHGDSSRTFYVGTPAKKTQRLVDATYDGMMAGIAVVRPGATLGDVGAAVDQVARAHRLANVRDFCGHGLGRVMHGSPTVLHYGEPGTGTALEPGMFFTIEPMFTAGRAEVKILGDGWTTVTRDRSWSAQFEHSVGVTADGVEVFTKPPS